MTFTVIISGLCTLLGGAVLLADESAEDALEKHREGSEMIAAEQDELSADVQQLAIEQTIPKVIELLGKVEGFMDEATDRLDEADTGGLTIAAQTEIIEMIHAAAKEKQSQSSSGKSGSAMMDMMERMMGKKPGGDMPGEGGKPGSQGGEGQTGESDTANEGVSGKFSDEGEIRRVPKASGGANVQIPEEFRKALDAYNRGVGEVIK